MVHCSTHDLDCRFYGIYGETLIEYVKKLQYKKANQYLINSDKTIMEIE